MTQLLFETIPQAALQVLLIVGIISTGKSTSIEPFDVYLSVASATLNSIFQIIRLKLESEACNEAFYLSCLQCLMARISWIPFQKWIEKYLSNPNENNKSNNEMKIIDYNINYSYIIILAASQKLQRFNQK